MRAEAREPEHPSGMRSGWSWKRGVVLALAIFFAGGMVSLHSYRGMTLGMLQHARHATFDESWNLSQTIFYWLEFMEKLRFDETTGFYGFPTTEVGGVEGCLMDFHHGEFKAAVQCLEKEIAEHGESEEKLFWLAMSSLRQGENDNCLHRLTAGAEEDSPLSGHHLDSSHGERQAYCTLPLTQHHMRPESSRGAARNLERLLDHYDPENRLYQWLLNFSAMTTNTFPEAVPEEYRVPPRFVERFYGAGRRAMAAKYSSLSFVDRAAELGVDLNDTGRGVAVEDFDGDGYLDLVTGGSFHVVRYFHNVEGTHFVERTGEVGLGDVKQPFAISAADFNGDGWMDLFVGRPFDCYRLFANRGDGTFVDVTASSGLLDAKRPEQVAATWISAWGDVDNDGDLDLFLAQWNFKMPLVRGLMATPRMDPTLFINQDGRFTDASEDYGLVSFTRDQYYIGATFGDYDRDGFPDLYLSSPLRGTSVLLRNVEGRRFERSEAVSRKEAGFVTAFVDVDHDGRLDIFQSGFSDARSSTEQAIFGDHLGRFRSGRSTILQQNDEGIFEERNEFFDGGEMPMSTMGSSYGDLDNDGCYDFYLGTGNPEGWFILPNLMYIGQREGSRCTGRMENISMLEGFGTVQKGHGIVFFDFDNDGDQDVYSSLGGMWPSDGWPNQLFVNESQLQRNWVKVRLRGRKTNRHGVGARIKVVAEAADGSEMIRYHQMDNGTGFGSRPYLAHIGLLEARSIREIEVHWPGTGCTLSYSADLNASHTLDEQECLTERAVLPRAGVDRVGLGG